MAILYDIVDKEWFAAPQLTRWRHAWKSPKSSYKINIEMDQFLFDITKLRADYTEMAQRVLQIGVDMYEGVDLDAEFDSDPVEILGVTDLVAIADQLSRNMRRMERTRDEQ